MIYFVFNPDTYLVKIGVTINLAKRMTSLASDYPRIELLGVMSGSFAEKTALHEQFARNRIRRTDWFRDGEPLRQYIAENCTLPDYAAEHFATLVDQPISLTPYARTMLDLWMRDHEQEGSYGAAIVQLLEELMPQYAEQARHLLRFEEETPQGE